MANVCAVAAVYLRGYVLASTGLEQPSHKEDQRGGRNGSTQLRRGPERVNPEFLQTWLLIKLIRVRVASGVVVRRDRIKPVCGLPVSACFPLKAHVISCIC